jgi:amino acid adenylation domain-containing protein/non-ribosomal peptide synthase protein (TIGR01720 family)
MVPICFEKSAWAIIAMLAVLKAGGAFVPLDPSHPTRRLKTIIEQLGSDILLISPHARETCSLEVEKMVKVSVAMVHSLPMAAEVLKVSRAAYSQAVPHHAMYILFTSGSTGTPKGVVMDHSAACSSVIAHGKAMHFGEVTRALQFASFGFDASIAEIFTTLVYGGCICVPSESERLEDIISVINKMEVNWAFFTPSFIGMIRPEDVPTLKTLVLGGEAVRKENIEIWADKVQLMNGYGPTETCVFCLTKEITLIQSRPETVGWTVGSMSWIVDVRDHDQLVPVGCVGELLIGGPQLARGYLNEAEKTATSFIENPPWVRNAELLRFKRMYKTGDLVRYNPDGTLDYLGRKDTQVKLRGQRLELGEVEHHLQSNDDVRDAMVMVPRKGFCQDRLVTVTALQETTFMAESGTELISHKTGASELQLVDKARMAIAAGQVSRVRQNLSSQIPNYMIPVLWIIVRVIPLNTSGKLDRAKVARWVQDMDEESYRQIVDTEVDETATPTTAMDQRLQDLLGGVLNLPSERIGLNRSFLSLGGDSITAMQVVSRARTENISIKVQDVLQSQTISQLALVAKISSRSLISREDEIDTVFALSPVQQMHFEMADQKVNKFNQSFFLRLTRDTHSENVARAVEVLVRQHSMLRSRFSQNDNGLWGQHITRDIDGSYRFTSYEMKNREELAKVVITSQCSLDISNGPMFAADLFNVEDDGQLLFLTAHHLVIDLVSWRIILQDLEEILISGKLSAEKPFSFQAWCKLQAEHAQQLRPKKVLPFSVTPADYAYWGMADRPNVYSDAVSESIVIDADTTAALLGSCQEALRIEPVEIFLATLLQAFSQTFSDRSTPVIFSEGHGREPWDAEIDLSATVGWFTTMLPLKLQVVEGADVVDTVRRTKDTRRKVPGNGLPYFASRFLNADGGKAFKDHLPMEVLFNYMGRYQQLERDDTLLREEPLPSGASGSDVSPEGPRIALFEFSVVVVHGVTQFSVVYNRHIQRQTDISRWMGAWKLALQEAARRLPDMEVERTLSDFPLLPMTYDGLDQLKNERLQEIGLSNLAEIEDVYPCSLMQQGLLLSQTKASGAYEVAFTYEVVPPSAGPLIDVGKLLSAWQQVVEQHAALRTVFVDSVSGALFDQIVLKRVVARATIKPRVNNETEAIAMLKEQEQIDHREIRPPHSFTVCQTIAGKAFFKLEINHAIIDAASMELVQRDLALAYTGSLLTSPRPLYSKYIEYLSDRPIRSAIDYWKGYLKGVEPCHFPPSSDDGAKELRHIGIGLDLPPDALSAFCERHRVTVPNVVQTVWGLVLRCYTGSDQVCFGYLASGRDIAVDGIEGVVGPLINMLMCRMDMNLMSQASQLVQEVQAGYLAGLEHQHCSLAQIQHELNLVGRPLFNTIMSVQRASSSVDVEPDATLSSAAVKSDLIVFKNVDAYDPTEASDTAARLHRVN